MIIIPLPAFSDNYIWVCVENGHAIIIDPGDARIALDYLHARQLCLDAVLLTHAHADHIGGAAQIKNSTACPVYGPSSITEVTHPVADKDKLRFPHFSVDFEVIALPGHTPEHLGYFIHKQPPAFFCGDTLFSAGCGRLLGGTAEQLYESLLRIKAMPPETLLYPAHEYTLTNLKFAAAAEPDNPGLSAYLQKCQVLRAAQKPTLPSTVQEQNNVNPFLRTHLLNIQKQMKINPSPQAGLETFIALRQWKDIF